MGSAARNYYEILGVARDATADEIHRAYRTLARRYHPDVNRGADAPARFDELSGAYEVLHDPSRRARYDRSTSRPEVSVRTAAVRAPVFSPAPRRRDVPRFLDEDTAPGGLPTAASQRRGVVIVFDSAHRPPSGVRPGSRDWFFVAEWW